MPTTRKSAAFRRKALRYGASYYRSHSTSTVLVVSNSTYYFTRHIENTHTVIVLLLTNPNSKIKIKKP